MAPVILMFGGGIVDWRSFGWDLVVWVDIIASLKNLSMCKLEFPSYLLDECRS